MITVKRIYDEKELIWLKENFQKPDWNMIESRWWFFRDFNQNIIWYHFRDLVDVDIFERFLNV